MNHPFDVRVSHQVVSIQKRTHCWHCERGIAPGERHIRQTGKMGGRFVAIRLHLECPEPEKLGDA